MSRPSAWYAICVLLLLLVAQPVGAHGGGILQIASQPAGPYIVSVWTSPARLEAGEIAHITVGVAGEDEAPILDAAVLVELASLETEAVWSAAATTEQATNKLFYEADMQLPENGRYTITIHVTGSQGQGDARFAVEILPKRQNNWISVSFIGLGLILSLLMFRFWGKQPTNTPLRKK